MKEIRLWKLFGVFLLIFAFAVPAVADVRPTPQGFVIYDDLAAEEAAALLEASRKSAGSEIGSFAAWPTYEFGGTQNLVEANWPASMRKAFGLAMPQDVKDWFKTPAFDYSAGHHSPDEDQPNNVGYFTSDKEQIQWFESLPTDRMKWKLITGFPYYTGDGPSDYALARTFQLIFAVFSKPSVFTPEEVKALGKPVIWLHGSIHGRETSPGEALLQLAKEFATGQHDDILEKLTVIIVPRFNVDGAWNAQRTTTALAPVGHAGLGTSGLDMNRDFIGFEAPLVRAVRQLQMAYDPVVSFCGHEMGYTWDAEYVNDTATGYRRGYDGVGLTTTSTLNLNVDKRVRDLGYYLFEPATKKLLEEKGVGWNWYIGGSLSNQGRTTLPYDEVVSSDGVSGPLSGDVRYTTTYSDFALVPEEGIGINGTALANQSLVFVHEAPAAGGNNACVRLDYLRRVYSQYLGALAICRTAADHRDEIMQAVGAARKTEIARTEPLSFWGVMPAAKDDARNVLEFKTWKKEDTPEVVNAIGFGTRPIKAIRAREAVRDSSASVTRPAAYIIPAGHYEAAIRLFYTGAQLERLASEQTLEVEAYVVQEIGSSDQSPSGSTSQVGRAIRRTSKTTKNVTFPKDSFVVRMDQLGASLAALALEPGAIRNYGNYYLSRTKGTSGNTARIPEWYRDTFLPVAVGQEFPCYRYMKSDLPETYSANMNVPMMLTSVAKVHSPTSEEVENITKALGLRKAPDYISSFELPVLSTDLSYKSREPITEAFLLPDGKTVDIAPECIVDDKRVLLVAPSGLGGTIYAAGKDGEFVKLYEPPSDEGDGSSGCDATASSIWALLILVSLAVWYRTKPGHR